MQERKTEGIGYLAGDWPLDPQKSTLLFIHGAGGSGGFWRAQIDSLAARVNTLAIDLPGHGNSGNNGKDKVEDYARIVADFIKTVDVPNPVPCGLSLGGAITQQLLLDYPVLLDAGILLNSGAKLKVAPEIFDILQNDYNGFIEMIGRLVASEPPNLDKIAIFKKQIARCNPEVTLGDFHACNRFDVMQKMASIALPVLVVSAEYDKLTPPKYGEFLEKMIPQASRSHMRNAGHIVPMEKPEEFNRVILNLLDHINL